MRSSIWLLVAKLFIFGFVFLIADFAIGQAFQYFRTYAFSNNPQYIEYKSQYAIEMANEEILIIGSSTASHHYVPRIIKDSIGLSVYNCAEDGCFFVYSNCVINLLLDRYSPMIILWEIGEDCLSTHYDEKSEYQFINHLYPYYCQPYIRNIVDKKDNYQKIRMLSKMYRYNSVFDKLIHPFIRKHNFDNGYVPIDYSGYNYPSVSKTIVESDINYDKVEMLKNTLENCKKHNVKVIITSSPHLVKSNIKSTNQYNMLLQICEQYKVPFIDYYNNDTFMQDSTLFKDINHLNDKGAKKYMECFIPELKKVIK